MPAELHNKNDIDTVISVSVWRGNEHGCYQDFAVPYHGSQTILDVVTWIQRHQDPTLSYRFACRVGMCGTCAMMVNGRPRWTCRTHVGKVLRGNRISLGPLSNLPVIKDLVVDMTVFFDKWQSAGGKFEGRFTRENDLVRVKPGTPARRAADAAIECIGCAVCYAACDVVKWKPDYLGPAALNRAWAGCNDSRAANVNKILDAVSDNAGCHSCHSHQSCAEHCPVGLNPTASISGLKRKTLGRLLSYRPAK